LAGVAERVTTDPGMMAMEKWTNKNKTEKQRLLSMEKKRRERE
jgi:hypothetical protein